MKPLADRVVLEQLAVEEKTASGIILPETAQRRPLKGRVIATGPSVKDVKVGDLVIYGQYAHQPFKDTGIEYIVINEPDVIAIVAE
jgi:chaperonin GroES